MLSLISPASYFTSVKTSDAPPPLRVGTGQKCFVASPRPSQQREWILNGNRLQGCEFRLFLSIRSIFIFYCSIMNLPPEDLLNILSIIL
jgi:hypothetical protein